MRKLEQFLTRHRVKKIKHGQVIWWILASEYTIIKNNNITDKILKKCAGVIAKYCGGTYMDYYYAFVPQKTIKKGYKKYRNKIMVFFDPH